MLLELTICIYKNALDPYFTSHTKINTKYIMNLHRKPETMKLLKEKKKEGGGTP